MPVGAGLGRGFGLGAFDWDPWLGKRAGGQPVRSVRGRNGER
jgi:hypothetical protein